MVEYTHYRSDQPDQDNQDITGNQRPRRYAFGRTANGDYGDSVPLFLADPDGEPDPEEYVNPLQPQRRLSLSFKLLMTASAAACVAVLFAWFTSDATRDVMLSAKASISTVLPIPSTAAQAEDSQPGAPSQLTAHDVQLKDPAQVKDPARWPSPAAQAGVAPRQQVASAQPSREAITSAYQSALQSRAPAAAPAVAPPSATVPVAVAPPSATVPVAVAPAAAPPPPPSQGRRIDADELAMLMKRARESLSAGDIPVARLLLERAADGQDPNAALMLAQTYDPVVLGTSDVRNITPEPDKARAWYQRAVQLGSADAQRRLAQMQN
jgi:TPR repeat protein